MTSNNWRAPERVGEHIGLTGEALSSFLSVVREVHRQEREAESDEYDLSKEHTKFLNEEVFSHPLVTSQLRELGVSDEVVARFEAGRVDIEAAFDTTYKFHYKLDQLVDFIMLIKLIKDYLEYTNKESVTPRNQLHYLVYLVNHDLKKSPVQSSRHQRTDLGMLEFTGYRYTFRKREQGPYSTRLSRDKDRLFAWDLVEERVDNKFDPNEFEPFQLSLGHSGRLLTMRHESRFNNLRKAGSSLLREWAFSQRDIIERFGSMSITELREHATSINEFSSTTRGRVLLTGRPRFFDPEEGDILTTISEGMRIA